MKKIKIAHLYYDLMNLYGENGNVLCLKKYLENQNINVTIDYLTKEDKIDFTNYDIFYIGSGNDESFLITLDDLKKYKKELETAIKNKFFIVTGNALNLFGKTYYSKNKEIELLNILKTVKSKKAVLISTIAVYPQPVIYNENYFDYKSDPNYGKNRKFAEYEFSKIFKDSYIIRLPALFGNNLKKKKL